MRDYKELGIWEIGREINKEIYLISGKFPKSEVYGLISQIGRVSVSIVSNTAEGCGKDSSKEFIQFLRISMGSIKEIESQLYIALDVGYINEEGFEIVMKRLDEIGRKLWCYIKYLKGKDE